MKGIVKRPSGYGAALIIGLDCAAIAYEMGVNGRGMALYRYMSADRASKLVNRGVMRVSAMTSFGSMKGDLQDELDGASRYRSGSMYIRDTNYAPAEVRALRRVGFDFDQSRDISVRDLIATASVSGSALCFSDIADNPHLLAQGSEVAVLRISSPLGFAQAVTRAAHGRLGQSVVLRSITYTDDVDAVGVTPMCRPDPFKKRLVYAPEREVRMFWPGASEPFVNIADARLCAFVERAR